MPVYTAEALARAMAPIDTVIASIVDASQQTSSDGSNSQARFVSLLTSIASQPDNDNNKHATQASTDCKEGLGIVDWASINFLPSRRYVQKLVQRYTSRLEDLNIDLDDDNLASLVCHFSMTKCGSSTLPDPTNCSIVTFRVPYSSNSCCYSTEDNGSAQSTIKIIDDDILTIRTYPHHNDVGVAKVWEAGACLAEYIMHNPQIVCGRNVVELGAGVGLTGLVAAGVAKATSVHMTDYTEVCLDNLAYNVKENGGWLTRRNTKAESVTVGKLEWGDYSTLDNESENSIDGNDRTNNNDYPWANSIEAISKANVLLAADVVYDRNCIPDLVSTVCKFLSQTSQSGDDDGNVERIAIFATTFRNKDTFALFEKELEDHNIVCEYDHSLEDLSHIFPCYWNQPRADVRVCTMSLKR